MQKMRTRSVCCGKERCANNLTKGNTVNIEGKAQRLFNRLLPYVENPNVPSERKTTRIVHVVAATCALVAIQPIPFADFFILTPIQIIMVILLGRVYGMRLTRKDASAILTSIIGTIGWGVMAQQLTLGLYKTILPFMGGITTIPLVYGWTWGLGKTAAFFLKVRQEGFVPSGDELRSVAKQVRKEGTTRARSDGQNTVAFDDETDTP